jgi:dTDP-4-amino-4,6-dideoxygalactose transaminase
MNVSAGSGAAFLTSDSALFMRALALRSPERSLCVPDDIDNVSTWSGEGGGFAPSDMLAALLEGQLLRLQELTRVRRRTWECYDEGLADLDLEAGGPLRRPHTPRRAADNAHAYTLQARTRALRDKLRKELSASGIETRVLAEPLHLSTYARRVLGPQPRLLRSEVVAECALQLPLSAGISKQQAERVVDVVRRVARPQRRRPHTLAPRSGKQTAHKGSIVPAS